MKLRRLVLIGWLAAVTLPGIALADDPEVTWDARATGYGEKTKTTLKDPGSLSSWFIFTPLALLAIGVMFKNANRTHLD